MSAVKKVVKKSVAAKAAKSTAAKRAATRKKLAEDVPQLSAPVTPSEAPSASAPAASPAAPAGRFKWLPLAILGVVAVLVVVETAVLLKNKSDRQRTLTEAGAFGERGGQPRPEAYQGAIAMKCGGDDRLYLVDPEWNQVVVYDTKASKPIMALDRKAAGTDEYTPVDAAATRDNTAVVLDRMHQKVYVFSPEGSLVTSFAAANGTAIAAGEKEIYVSDNNRMQIVKYSLEGRELQRIGAPGTGKGKLSSPGKLGVDAAGNIFVINSGNNRVEAYGPDGKFTANWPFNFKPNSLLGIAVHDEIYLNDFDGGCLWAYTKSGKLAGQIKIAYPSNMAVDSQGNFYLPTATGVSRYVQNRAGDE